MRLDQFVIECRAKGLRLGQAFCNKYNLNWPSLYYETNDTTAVASILGWMEEHQYSELP